MRYLLTAGAAFTVALAFDTTFIGGNHYGNEVTKMKITGFDDSGEYNSIVGMDVESGACSSQPVQYSGPLGSLGKEVRVWSEFFIIFQSANHESRSRFMFADPVRWNRWPSTNPVLL